MDILDDTLRLVQDWRAAWRASRSDDYASHRAGYERRAADYAAVIRSRVRKI